MKSVKGRTTRFISKIVKYITLKDSRSSNNWPLTKLLTYWKGTAKVDTSNGLWKYFAKKPGWQNSEMVNYWLIDLQICQETRGEPNGRGSHTNFACWYGWYFLTQRTVCSLSFGIHLFGNKISIDHNQIIVGDNIFAPNVILPLMKKDRQHGQSSLPE